MVYITDAAARELQRLEQQQGLSQPCLIVEVTADGCLDWSYRLSFEAQIPDGYIELPRGGEPPQNGQCRSFAVAIAPMAQAYAAGLKIDYSEDLLGGAFRFHNPNAANTCSCGQSFEPAG
ncbi:MAG: HesB/IscA family protein [Elainellaceae cyanobacterium]